MSWSDLGRSILAGKSATRDEALAVVRSSDDELLDVLAGAFLIRKVHYGREVRLHLIRNARSGSCSEDCGFCSQAGRAESAVSTYDLQGAEALLAGAREAAAVGAMRYCIVTSGREAAESDVDQLCAAVRAIKREVSIEICTSLGLLDDSRAQRLRAAGVDRYNHNLEASERFFPEVCSTHDFSARLATARRVKAAGMSLCCGGIIGMGESLEDRVDLALALAEIGADSVPVNFFNPRPGTPFGDRPQPTPSDCLRALALFRYVNPKAEVRAAGGREACLGPLQALALYPANSIFTNGYLTTAGQGSSADLDMIRAAGFTVGAIVHAD